MRFAKSIAGTAVGLWAVTSLSGQSTTETTTEDFFDLGTFIVEESAALMGDSLSPLAGSTSAFGEGLLVQEVPRSLSLLTPETLETFGIRDFDDLASYGAGTQRINYFGLPGIPVLRGSRAGVYFNGMLRAFQRNEMPTSFGSTEGLEVVKGPAPAHLTPTLVGGYVNLLPKSPFFERTRGSLQLEVGEYDHTFTQLDFGGPFQMGPRPAAYRVSLSAQRSESYYQHIENDFESAYLALKVKLGRHLRLFTGGEYYDFRSSEVPGINRPTQQLIDSGEYVIGEPALLTSPAYGDTVIRPLMEFPNTLRINPALHALAIPGDIARERIPAELRALMLDLNDPATVANLYTASRPELNELLAQTGLPLQDAYVYTPAYLAAGGEVLTEKIDPRNILADPDDKADARNFIWFADLESSAGADWTWENKTFVEGLETEKYSTYGFAFESEQFVAADRLTFTRQLGFLDTRLSLGGELRGTYASVVQDFDAEPFSRRDLTRDSISPNSVVIAGPQRGEDGQNLWSTFGGASEQSHLYQAATFVSADSHLGERLRVFYSLRAENAWWRVGLPGKVDQASPEQRAARERNGDEFLLSGSLNPVFTLVEGLNLYGAVQLGRALAPGDGGTVSGPDSFTDVELYEVGLKASLLDQHLFTTLSAYYWAQSVFSSRDNEARPLRGRGVEWELTYTGPEGLSVITAFTAQRVELAGDAVGFGAVYFGEPEAHWALNGGILSGDSARDLSRNPDQALAGFPELSASLLVHYRHSSGFGGAAGPIWRDRYWHDIERNLRLPSHVLWTASLFYGGERWEFRATVENLFDEEYWIGQDPIFAANTLVTPGTPRTWRASATYKW